MTPSKILRPFTLVFSITMAMLITAQGYAEETKDMTLPTQGGAESSAHSGIVLETMDAANYTYLNIDENGNKYWIAAPQMKVSVGEKVNFISQVEMTNFESKTLNRTFDKIIFVGKVHLESSGQDLPAATSAPESVAEAQPETPPTTPQTLSDDAKMYTVEELYAKKDELKGKLVKVKGDVTKVNENIMGKNWVHIKDGTGKKGSDDIVFTSRNATATVGSVVTAQGLVDTDKDYGSGYSYPIIVEESIFVK